MTQGVSTPATGALSVIVVDDEPDVAAYLAAVLERHGHTAVTASTAADGFDLAKKIRPDVVCVDIVMPEETGTALLRRIRADRDIGGTTVVFITALKREMIPVTVDADGLPSVEPDAFIEKPPNADRFVDAVERAFRKARSTS
ncbi:MAG: response regulator [Holophagae bacterium]|jgi:CheY-like chemotaxis protein